MINQSSNQHKPPQPTLAADEATIFPRLMTQRLFTLLWLLLALLVGGGLWIVWPLATLLLRA